jgi:hypothetical protein
VTLLRSLFVDLVARRLWPIALLLAITAVAVPVVLGRSGAGAGASAAGAPVTAAGGDGTASATPVVELVGPAKVRGRSGPVRDPFRRARTKTATTVTHSSAQSKTSAASASGSGSAGAAADSSAATTATRGAPVAATPAAAGATAPSTAIVYRARVRWGADEHVAVRGLSRLQPLGGPSNPALLYLGTTARGTRAIFLLGPNAGARGDGTCAERTCRVMRLKAGDTTVVTVQGTDGGAPRQRTLVVDAITRRDAASDAAARTLRARVDRDGRDVLRAIIKDRATAAAIGRFRFDSALGAVVAITAP